MGTVGGVRSAVARNACPSENAENVSAPDEF
jgi:hypothetical protein